MNSRVYVVPAASWGRWPVPGGEPVVPSPSHASSPDVAQGVCVRFEDRVAWAG